MKRYFLVQSDDLAAETEGVGVWHSIDLGSHDEAHAGKHLVVVVDAQIEPPTTWHELPHLLDPGTTIEHREHAAHRSGLAVVGAPAAATGFALARHLATIHPQFKP